MRKHGGRFGGRSGRATLVLARARAHRPLITAALVTVLLTTSVLAALAAYSTAIGDAALRHSLAEPRNTADAALVVKAEVAADRRRATDTAVRDGARRTFDGLPVTVRTLVRSGPYALPATTRAAATRPGDKPDLTHFAALDSTQVRLSGGRLPRAGAPDVEVAMPETAARRLRLAPGARLTVTDRLDGPPVRILVTGVYRPAEPASPYWLLDELGGRGVRTAAFTTYGPLLTTPSVVTGGRVSDGGSAWLASADFARLTADRIGALRTSARTGPAALRKLSTGDDSKGGTVGKTTASTALPEVLDRVERSLLVSRSTLLIVALQLALLATCALLLVARLLAAERTGETQLLRARGASRAALAGLAAREALLLAGPALLIAPLLAGPLVRLLAGQGALARLGLELEVPAGGQLGVWLTAVGVALGCALAVALPAVAPTGFRTSRARALPAPLRAGADLGLVAVAGVAYWQLDRRTSGAVSADTTGALGIDPLLVAAPALALLAGAVLTLRLLPLAARLAERRATGGRGLAAALAGWQLSRRPGRGAGPVLLLVLAVALGVLAIGQSSSWERSQEDQADFAAGAPVRVLGAGSGELGRTQDYAAVPHVREAVPAVRTTLPLSGGRTTTVLTLDTAHAADTVLLRPDLAPAPMKRLLAGLGPSGESAGARVPAGATRLTLTATLLSSVRGTKSAAAVTQTLEDDHGVPYPLPSGDLPADGRPHALSIELPSGHGPLTLTGVQLVLPMPSYHAEQHTLTLDALTAATAAGTAQRVSLPTSWTAASGTNGQDSADPRTSPTRARVRPAAHPTVVYGTGYVPSDQPWLSPSMTLRMQVTQPRTTAVAALVTDRFLASAGARPGQTMDIAFQGQNVPVRIVRAVRQLPTAQGGEGDGDGGAVLLDLHAVNRVLQARYGAALAPTEWWLRPDSPSNSAAVATALRARPDLDPWQIVVRDEIAAELRDDPFGAGPEAAFTAAAGAAAVLAALGFAVSAAGALRERNAEFAILRALGAPRRRLARAVAAEHGVLVALALAVGTGLGIALTRAVLPLIVLTGEATRPVPDLLVELPPLRVAALLTAVAAVPVVVVALLAVRQADPVQVLREGE
ncbi:FtsX-like permease family protein [Streptomyces sp. NBC_01618]|uniref:FtsX-like permease family protein n=1 Tax=Streptomyces sp. NBC_01618 TaxID=2975900 RepID=UPI0038673581|nr:FtsX-like permease family protein [Streptomyces sp. NBC_01618]